jgi:lysozyme family protein
MPRPDRFAACLAEVRRHEGGYVDHTQDPGGCTNRGITRRTLEGWRRQPVTCEHVRSLTEAEARAIYRAHYWNAVHGDELPAGIDLAVFDAAVHSGRRRAALWLQGALGLTPDGVIGPQTLRAVRRAQDRADVIARLCSLRLAFLETLPHWPAFRRGWSRRVQEVRGKALAMVGAS